MQPQAKTKGLFLAAGILIGMLVAFGVVWLDLERITHNISQEVKNLLPKNSNQKSKTDTLVIVEKQAPDNGGYDSDIEIPDTALYPLDTLPLPVDSLGMLVKKDELLYVKNIKVIRITASEQTAIDTAIAKAADVEPTGMPDNYAVEFWKSPINYRGYKLGRSKIVLFGIYQADDIALLSIGNTLFLKNRDFYFKLEPTENFLSLNAVTDRNLLTQLNQ